MNEFFFVLTRQKWNNECLLYESNRELAKQLLV